MADLSRNFHKICLPLMLYIIDPIESREEHTVHTPHSRKSCGDNLLSMKGEKTIKLP